jgi:putative ABC transport system permease protein
MHTLLSDMRFALRAMRRSPAFTVVAILTLALAIGANTAIFSFLDGVLLKPLPYPEPHRIVNLWEKPPNYPRNGISALNFLDWKDQQKVFSHIAAISGSGFTLTGSGEPERLNTQLVSSSYFDLFGSSAALGRTFAPEEDEPGKDKVVVLTHRIWSSRFGADPGILNRSLVLNGKSYTVIGVLPAASVYDRSWADIWVPLALDRKDAKRDFHWLRAFARLKPGVSIERARAEMSAIAGRIAAEYPDIKKGWGAVVDPHVDNVVGSQLRQSLWVLFAAVGAVLLIGCANLANLMLARGAARNREVAIRSALGAGRRRLLRHIMTECLLISGLGAGAGLVVGYGLKRAITAAMPPFMLPPQANVSLDWRVLLFTTLLAILTAVFFGHAPALQSTGGNPAGGLRDGGRSATTGISGHRLRNGLIIAEIALAFVLLSGAGLLMRSFSRLLAVDAGFDTTNVITMGLPRLMGEDTDPDRLSLYYRRIVDEIASLGGVRDVALTSALPMQGWGFGMPFQIAGQQVVDRAKRRGCFFKIVTPSYFRSIGMRLLQGRPLSDSDAKGSMPVTVINETFAKQYFKNQDPIGQRVLIEQIITGKHELGPDIPWQIVGVVADERVNGLDSEASSGVYVPLAQSPVVGVSILVRGAGEPTRLVKAIQTRVWSVDKNQALTNIRTLEAIKSETLASNRLRTVLLGIFAAIALALAAVGVYGVISYTVAQRTHEMGIRSALGASSVDLIRVVVGGSLLLVLGGLILGALGAFGLNRLLASLLFNTSPTDMPTLFTVAGILAAVGIMACYVPAARTTRVDPMRVLRSE